MLAISDATPLDRPPGHRRRAWASGANVNRCISKITAPDHVRAVPTGLKTSAPETRMPESRKDEPFVDPAHLLACLRCFVEAVQPATPCDPACSRGGGAAAAAAEAELCWEEAGCLVWDAAAMPDDAEYLVQELPELAGLLAATLASSAAAERWRALEICLGIVGNLASHTAPKRRLLQHQGLPELLVDRLLWLDDAPSLAECCRCLATVLDDPASDSGVRPSSTACSLSRL